MSPRARPSRADEAGSEPAGGETDPGRSRRPWSLLLRLGPIALVVFIVSAIYGLAVVAVAGLFPRPQRPEEAARIIEAPPPEPTPSGTAPAVEAERVHAALHDIGAWCKAAPTARLQRQLDRDVDTILSFADRYPEATFPIDDETGRALTLLITTRYALRTCAPSAAARVDHALPRRYQNRPDQFTATGVPTSL